VTTRLLTARQVAAGAALMTLLTGCGYEGAKSLPLPGGVGGPHTYTVTVVLDDATNLVPQETCRSNDTVIGSVESVELDDELKARVVCRIADDVHLPANATATLRETSLLGERFVSIDPPAGQAPRGTMAPGTTLPAATTRVDPDVEMVLGALSQVLNGGSLGKIETITRELTTALQGSDVHGTIESLSSVVGTLDQHRGDITAALVSLDRLSGRLARQRAVIAGALDSIPAGLEVLDRQRPRLVRTLRKLSQLSQVAVPLIRRTQADTVADLRHLAPVLSQLTKAGDEIALTLARVSTFPFPSNTPAMLGGDYGGMYGTLLLDVDALNELLGGAGVPVPDVPTNSTPSNPTVPVDPQLPDLGGLVPTLPGLPGLGLGSGTSDSGDTLGGLLGGVL
jgi:phospholipid/cholesterol/gamma-HCH transport system substrate-binding protein